MDRDMEQQATRVAVDACRRYDGSQDIAMYIKKEFDRQYPTYWHCCAGANFGR